MNPLEPALEAVYYSAPLPRSLVSLTFLGLVFDRLHFAGVYLPSSGFDVNEALAEAERIEKLGQRGNDPVLVASLRILKHVPMLEQFCAFSPQQRPVANHDDDKRAAAIVEVLDMELFGPPPPGFTPTHAIHNFKSIPNSKEGVDYPGELYYPARAIVYASDRSLPLVNDVQGLPIPALGGTDAKNNAKVLATVLALECAKLALPHVRPLRPEEIVEAREELRPHLGAYRRAILKLTKDLNTAITSSATAEDVAAAARFLVETEVQPTLAELEVSLAKPGRDWLNVGMDVAKQVPELVSSFATMPPEHAIAKVLATIGGALREIRDKDGRKEAMRSPLYYLLRMRDMQQQ